MKKNLILTTLLTVCFTFSYGQHTDSISLIKVFGGYQIYQGPHKLTMNQLANTLKPNDEAYQIISKAKSNNTLAMIFGLPGSFLVGYTLGGLLVGGEPNWVLAGIGAGMLVISIPLISESNSKLRQAVSIYNDDRRASAFRNKKELMLGMNEHGIGLRFKF